MLKTHKFRIYPNNSQRAFIEKTFNVCRFVYNLALETKVYAWNSARKQLSSFDLCYQLPELKDEYKWISEVNAQSIQESIKRIDIAFDNFFKGGGFPKFKGKHGPQSFKCPQTNSVDFESKTISIRKLKNIKASISCRFEGQIKSIVISKTATQKYFASICIETGNRMPIKQRAAENKTIGLDLGLKAFVTTSDGRSFEPNRHFKNSLHRLKCLQRRASRKKKGGNNHKKENLCVAKLHERIKNQRLDYCHKITTILVRDSQADTFVIEDLNVSGMLKNRKLSQAISDVGFGEFLRQIKYKCEWYGKNLIQIGRFEPSSKTCSECGHIKDDLTLTDREWTCANCNTTHDRDLNAAKNIKRMGLEKYAREGISGEPVESRRLRRAKKQEKSKTTTAKERKTVEE